MEMKLEQDNVKIAAGVERAYRASNEGAGAKV